MSIVLVTGSAGLIGSEAARFYCVQNYQVVGIDNNMRKVFFGNDACTDWNKTLLENEHKNYLHLSVDIRNQDVIDNIFKKYGSNISLVIHAAAQPSHDWAASDPQADFTVNANGTLVLLEAYKKYSPEATFVFTSTNKVYGDTPNNLPLLELDERYDIDPNSKWKFGIDETMSIDQSKHSLFGASKLAADILVQEYGRYFGLKTGVFRGGCLTGPSHSGTKLHGFLSYLMKCCITGSEYTIYGYKGKQVRDNIHSSDLINAFDLFHKSSQMAEVYNIGGGLESNCSMLEAIAICQNITGNKLNLKYDDKAREGDHIWWISDTAKFKKHFPEWICKYDVPKILNEIYLAHK